MTFFSAGGAAAAPPTFSRQSPKTTVPSPSRISSTNGTRSGKTRSNRKSARKTPKACGNFSRDAARSTKAAGPVMAGVYGIPGNALATRLLRLLFGARFTDLGPFRAIRWDALEALGMRDRGFGWTVEMQALAARGGLRFDEVPVRYRRRRGGRSKVAGTVRGAVGAGAKILVTIARVRLGG